MSRSGIRATLATAIVLVVAVAVAGVPAAGADRLEQREPPALRDARGARVAFPRERSDAVQTLRYAKAALASERRARASRSAPRVVLSREARAAVAELQALHDGTAEPLHADFEPHEREAGHQPDPLLLLRSELARVR